MEVGRLSALMPFGLLLLSWGEEQQQQNTGSSEEPQPPLQRGSICLIDLDGVLVLDVSSLEGPIHSVACLGLLAQQAGTLEVLALHGGGTKRLLTRVHLRGVPTERCAAAATAAAPSPAAAAAAAEPSTPLASSSGVAHGGEYTTPQTPQQQEQQPQQQVPTPQTPTSTQMGSSEDYASPLQSGVVQEQRTLRRSRSASVVRPIVPTTASISSTIAAAAVVGANNANGGGSNGGGSASSSSSSEKAESVSSFSSSERPTGAPAPHRPRLSWTEGLAIAIDETYAMTPGIMATSWTLPTRA